MMINKKVKDIMTRDVITTNPEIDVVHAFEKLMKYKLSSMPVMEEDKMVGIITASDLGHNLILDKYELGTQVKNIMVRKVFYVAPDDSIEVAIKTMTDSIPGSGIVNQLPVLDNGKLVGIISDGDIIKFCL